MKTWRHTLLLWIVALLTLAPGRATAESFDLENYGNETDYTSHTEFIITSQEGLAKMAELINSNFGFKFTFKDKVIALQNDIRLAPGEAGMDAAEGWTPIAVSGFFAFEGTFEGNNHTISNLTIPAANGAKYRGLFGEIKNAAIRNLTLEAVLIECSQAEEQSFMTGAIAGKAYNSQIRNCHVVPKDGAGRIEGSEGTHESCTGGLFGFFDGGEINLCSNSTEVTGGNIENSSDTGGLIGLLLAYESPVTLNNSFNKGSVTRGNSTTWSCTGGLIGQYTGEQYGLTLTDCYNTGNIFSSTSLITGDEETGGLIGYATNHGTSLRISTSFSFAEIEGGTRCTGGLIGYLDNQEGELGEQGECILENCLAVIPSMSGPDNLTRLLVGFNSGGSLANNYSWTGDTDKFPATDNRNGAAWNGRTDAPPFKGENKEDIWSPDVWNFDASNRYLPVFAAAELSEVQENIGNPKWEVGASVYHTITLETAPGILLNGITPGVHTMEQGDFLHLQFMPEDATLTADDILFVMDGETIAFKDFGNGSYFNYMLSGIDRDHAFLIALKEYGVTLPEVEGADVDPSPGVHMVGYGKPFYFSLLPDDDHNLSPVRAYLNGEPLEQTIPEEPDALRLSLIPYMCYYKIDRVDKPIEITFDKLIPDGTVGNAAIDTQIRLYAADGAIHVENATAGTQVNVYSPAGSVSAQQTAGNSHITIPLAKGLYIVKIDQAVFKVVVR